MLKNKKKYILSFGVLFLFTIAFLLIMSSEPEPKIIAKIGNKVITESDFLLNYEFGLPHLKIGKTSAEKKEKYLQFMINEYLLSLDGEEKGLLNTPAVLYQTKKLKKELLLESIIENEIKPNIHVSNEEIKEAINKSKVSFKFFYWSEKELRNAKIIKEMFEKNGVDETFKILKKSNPDVRLNLSKYTTDYLTWLEIPEETFAVLKDLPANEFSNPVKIDGSYFIFQIKDIRRATVTTKEYLDKSSTFRKILFNYKLQDEVVNYVDKQVSPKNVITKINTFNILANAVIDWAKSDERSSTTFKDWTEIHKDTASVKSLNSYKDSVFITYSDGNFTLSEFQKYIDFDKVNEEFQTKKQFKYHLNSVLGVSIRDYFLVKEAKRKGYDKSSWFEHEYMKWTSKFVFEENLRNYMFQKTSDSVSVADVINRDLEVLKSKYKITIDKTMLDTLTVKETEKSKQSFVQLMKGGVDRLAEPIVDGHWKSIIK